MNIDKYFSSLSLTVAAVSLVAFSSPVRAEHQNACKDDIQKFCSSVDPKDHKAVHACLKKNKDNVSDACKQQMNHKRGQKKSGDTNSSVPAPTNAPSGSAAGQ
jgi:hypothetical protein